MRFKIRFPCNLIIHSVDQFVENYDQQRIGLFGWTQRVRSIFFWSRIYSRPPIVTVPPHFLSLQHADVITGRLVRPRVERHLRFL
jgi:hypothetical protein